MQMNQIFLKKSKDLTNVATDLDALYPAHTIAMWIISHLPIEFS